jgi:ubiquinone/menaquinone biosynthesis C-methylase UbiE
MGYFSIPAARIVGPEGRVVCVDIQERMLKALRRRSAKAGVSERIETVLVNGKGDWLGAQAGTFDLALLFHVIHEVPDPPVTFARIAQALKPGGRVLLAEPSGHVSDASFREELKQAAAAGLSPATGPRLPRSRTALLQKT